VLHSRAAGKPLTCAQQYTNWKDGPAQARGRQLANDASALSTAGKNEDIEVPNGSRTGDPIGFSWKGTGSSGRKSSEVFS
jgi:hypothetical protein